MYLYIYGQTKYIVSLNYITSQLPYYNNHIYRKHHN